MNDRMQSISAAIKEICDIKTMVDEQQENIKDIKAMLKNDYSMEMADINMMVKLYYTQK